MGFNIPSLNTYPPTTMESKIEEHDKGFRVKLKVCQFGKVLSDESFTLSEVIEVGLNLIVRALAFVPQEEMLENMEAVDDLWSRARSILLKKQ